MSDLMIQCVGCRAYFTWTDGEQTYFASRGLSRPRRCKSCRSGGGGGSSSSAPASPRGSSRRPEVCPRCGTPDGTTYVTNWRNQIPHGAKYREVLGGSYRPDEYHYTVRIQSTGDGRWRCQSCQKIW